TPGFRHESVKIGPPVGAGACALRRTAPSGDMARLREVHMRRVIFTPKGGVGKSSITCNLAAVSASRGLRTLVVDLDIQGNATEYLLDRKVGELRDTVEDLFEQSLSLNLLGKRAPESYVHASRFPNLSVMPAGPSM